MPDPFDNLPSDPARRVTVWEKPRPGRTYVAGADFGYGIGRDADALCILDVTYPQPRQVAELHGQWGEAFDDPIVKMLKWYNNAFLVGEHQVGGPIMARIHRVHNYPHMYRETKEDAITKTVTHRWGWARRYDDITLRNLRAAVLAKKVIFRSTMLIEQMRTLNFYTPGQSDAHHHDDDTLRMRLPIGESGRRPSPDLVMAACYALHASTLRAHHEPVKPKYAHGSANTMSEADMLKATR